MNASTWRRSNDLRKLLLHVLDRLSERKRSLLVVACCRAIWSLLGERGRRVVELVEEYADGRGDRDELRVAAAAAEGELLAALLAYRGTGLADPAALDRYTAADAASYAAIAAIDRAASLRAAMLVEDLRDGVPVALLRDLVGDPFTTVRCDPAWLAWNAGAVEQLARAIYEQRRFEETPLLADALAEAGCAEVSLLAHLRETTSHVRGCWALDSLLGKR